MTCINLTNSGIETRIKIHPGIIMQGINLTNSGIETLLCDPRFGNEALY